MIKLYKSIEKWLIKHSIPLFLISMVVWILHFYYYTRYLKLSQEAVGQIGDNIGGFFGPMIGFFSALLVYKSFQEQKKANDIISEQVGTEHGFMLLNKIDEIMLKIEKIDNSFFDKMPTTPTFGMLEHDDFINDINQQICLKYSHNQVVNLILVESYNIWRNGYLVILKELNILVGIIVNSSRYKVVHPLLAEKIFNYLNELDNPYIKSSQLLKELGKINPYKYVEQILATEIERCENYIKEFQDKRQEIVNAVLKAKQNDQNI